MTKPIIALIVAGATLAATPALAGHRQPVGVYDEANPHYLDFQTDLSEARRELRSDLARANDQGDRVDAWAEYRQEVADARHDFAKEMAEQGIVVGNPTVIVEPGE